MPDFVPPELTSQLDLEPKLGFQKMNFHAFPAASFIGAVIPNFTLQPSVDFLSCLMPLGLSLVRPQQLSENLF